MREEPSDHVVTGFKVPTDGWHKVEFTTGIDWLPGKGGEGVYQNERGFKTLKLPCIVKDDADPDDGASVDQLIGMEKGHAWMAHILRCVGLWDAIEKKYPEKNKTVLDPDIVDGIKSRLAGFGCMMKTELDKDKKVRIREMASFAKYKEILAAELLAKQAAPAQSAAAQPAAGGNAGATGVKAPW